MVLLRVEMVQVYMCGVPESRNGTGVYMSYT